MFAIFIGAFFSKQELLWALSMIISGMLMISSYAIEIFTYAWNSSLNAYEPVTIAYSYPYLMGVNLAFFGLALVLGLFDLFDKYGNS